MTQKNPIGKKTQTLRRKLSKGEKVKAKKVLWELRKKLYLFLKDSFELVERKEV